MKNRVLIFLISGIAFLSACRKDYVMVAPVDLNAPVSFSKDIIPIFTASCAIPTCHITGGQKPELTASAAYDQLLSLAYVDTTQALENNVLYNRITSSSKPMPASGKLTSDKTNKILAWILQGAKDN